MILIIDRGDSQTLTWIGILTLFIIGQIVGIPIMSGLLFLTYNNLKEKTRLKKNPDEIALMSDRAFLIDNDRSISGRLILTNQRLCFRSKKQDYTKYDFLFTDQKPEFEKLKIRGFPCGFSINGTQMKVKLDFHKFWLNEIEKQISLIEHVPVEN